MEILTLAQLGLGGLPLAGGMVMYVIVRPLSQRIDSLKTTMDRHIDMDDDRFSEQDNIIGLKIGQARADLLEIHRESVEDVREDIKALSGRIDNVLGLLVMRAQDNERKQGG